MVSRRKRAVGSRAQIVMHVDRGAKNYLRRALATLRRECGAPGDGVGAPASFLVVDATRGAEGAAFGEAKNTHEADARFRFSRLGAGRRRLLGAAGKTAKQARDVSAALRIALRSEFAYALLLEDDWVACHGFLGGLLTATARAAAVHGRFSALRVSYGLNGIVVPRDRVASLREHVDRRAAAKPPDLAFTEWALAADGALVAYRHNLFVHVGAQSSVGNSGSRWNAACYELLFDWLQREGEAFDVRACGHDVVSPCDPPPRPLPHPERRAKQFACDVALMDLPVDRASDRLLGCVRDHVPASARGLLPASRASRD